MKCPQCGDDMVNGACRFCGYRPTAEDREAMERWAAQKKALENGSAQEPSRHGRPAKQPAARNTAKPPGKAEGRTVMRPKTQTEPKTRTRKPKQPKARDGPGFFGRLLPRAVVFIWATLLIYLIVTELAAGAMP